MIFQTLRYKMREKPLQTSCLIRFTVFFIIHKLSFMPSLEYVRFTVRLLKLMPGSFSSSFSSLLIGHSCHILLLHFSANWPLQPELICEPPLISTFLSFSPSHSNPQLCSLLPVQNFLGLILVFFMYTAIWERNGLFHSVYLVQVKTPSKS